MQDSNVESDDKDDGLPPLMDTPNSDRNSGDDDDVAGVTRRTRFQDINNFAGVANDEEAIETFEGSKRKQTKRDQLKD